MAKEQKEDKALVLFKTTDELIKTAKNSLILETIETEDRLNQLENTYKSMTIAGIKDMPTYKAVEQGIKDLKKLRILVDKRRKAYTEPAVKWQKSIKSEADRIINIIKPLETHLLAQKQTIDDENAVELNRLFTERSKKLAEKGYQLVGDYYVSGVIQVEADKLAMLTVEEMQFYVDEGDRELKRKDAADKKLTDALAEVEKLKEELKGKIAKYGDLEDDKNPEEETKDNEEKPPAVTETADLDTKNVGVTTDVEIESAGEPKETQEINDTLYNEGFDEMRQLIITLLSGTEKYNRKQIIQWCKDQKPTKYVAKKETSKRD